VLRFPCYWMSGSAHRASIYFEICMLRTRHDNISRITVGRAADGNEPHLPILTARTATYAICFDIYVVFGIGNRMKPSGGWGLRIFASERSQNWPNPAMDIWRVARATEAAPLCRIISTVLARRLSFDEPNGFATGSRRKS
jgi:hypothetical protein